MPSPHTLICKTCSEQFQPLEGKRCTYCSRTYSESICADCLAWKKHRPTYDTLDSNYAIYPYSDIIQTVLAKWKYRGDYEIGHLFKPMVEHVFQTKLSTYDSPLIVPIPLSDERLYERAFNQAEVIAKWIHPQIAPILRREHREKQSKRTRYERITSKNPFILTKTINKRVLLVDDIYTTGTTLRHASTLLKENGCPRVDAFTLIRS